jgi:hypothetical protein
VSCRRGIRHNRLKRFEEDVQKNKDSYYYAFYSFEENGEWFTKDCLTGEIIPFEEDNRLPENFVNKIEG